MITQSQYDVCRQPTRELYIKFDILNTNDVVIDSLIGTAVKGNINIDANTSHRRSGDITLVLSDDRYIPKPYGAIWFNNRCRIEIGIKAYTGEVVWFRLGTFAFADVDVEEDGTNAYMSCRLLDYMAFLDGTLGGKMSSPVFIETGQVTIREAILGVLGKEFRSIVSHVTSDDKTSSLVPYDIEHSINTTKYDILNEILNLYSGYEMFFDVDGMFVVQKIPDYHDDYPIEIFGDERSFDFTINSGWEISFEDIHNEIMVWGHTDNETGKQYRSRMCNKGSVGYVGDLNGVDKKDGDVYYVQSNDSFYVYRDKNWEKLDNFYLDPELSVDKIGLKSIGIQEDTILSDEQADLRARYELEQHNEFVETLKFTIAPLYYLDVNKTIDVYSKTVKGRYLIKNISFGLDIKSLMNVGAIKVKEVD